jgi:ABC-type multidrug transport system ATPase subunit
MGFLKTIRIGSWVPQTSSTSKRAAGGTARSQRSGHAAPWANPLTVLLEGGGSFPTHFTTHAESSAEEIFRRVPAATRRKFLSTHFGVESAVRPTFRTDGIPPRVRWCLPQRSMSDSERRSAMTPSASPVESGPRRALRVELAPPRRREKVRVELEPGSPVVLGCDRGCDVVLDEPNLLPLHARLAWEAGGLRVRALDGARVAVNGRVCAGETPVADGDWLTLGTTPFAVTLLEDAAGPTPVRPARPPAAHAGAARGGSWTIGRLEDCALRIDSPLVSRRHALLVAREDGAFLEDLDSTNGTFVDGRRIQGRVALHPGMRVEIGAFCFLFDGAALRQIEGTGTIRLEARELRKTVRDAVSGEPRDLLRDVSLVVEPGQFVGIFGTSGSGKSTLLDALNGRRPASSGSVLYNGADLYRCFDLFRGSIGYVPQQDIVHRRVTIRRALRYVGRLRLPPDTSPDEIDEYIERVLQRVGLAEKADQPIDTPAPLSGGQLKRVSLAVELISNPAVIFLDEATSGLDAATDKRMMRLFADLAADGKTVVCVTHTLESIDLCHRVALLHRGRLVFFGPPAAAQDHFRVPRLSEVYDVLEASPPEQWAESYRRSEAHARSVADRSREAAEPVPAAPPAAAPRRGRSLRQAAVLSRRYVDLLLTDRRNLAVLLLQAPLIGLVVGLVFDTAGAPAQRAGTEMQVAFMMVISAIWFGCLNAAREIVKELPIYLRERAVNLGIAPYLASKLLPLAVVCLLQTAALVATIALLLDVSGSHLARAGVLWLTGLAATGLGLCVSAAVGGSDKAIATVPILLIPQVVLAGAIVPLTGASEAVARASMISFWSFAAMKQTLGEAVRTAVGPTGLPVVSLDQGTGTCLAMLGLFLAASVGLAAAGLRWKDRTR